MRHSTQSTSGTLCNSGGARYCYGIRSQEPAAGKAWSLAWVEVRVGAGPGAGKTEALVRPERLHLPGQRVPVAVSGYERGLGRAVHQDGHLRIAPVLRSGLLAHVAHGRRERPGQRRAWASD